MDVLRTRLDGLILIAPSLASDDRIFAGMFRHLLDRLAALAGPGGGTLLDDTVALAEGPQRERVGNSGE